MSRRHHHHHRRRRTFAQKWRALPPAGKIAVVVLAIAFAVIGAVSGSSTPPPVPAAPVTFAPVPIPTGS
jgi:hypothetical protein